MSLESDLFDKWVKGILTRDDIQAEVNRLAESIKVGLPSERKALRSLLTEKDLQHIGFCLHKLHEWWWDRETIGPFLTAFVADKLTKTWRLADRANFTGLGIYVEYLYQHAPGTWRWKKAKDYERE